MHIKQARIEDIDQLVELFDAYRTFYNNPSDKAGAKSFLTDRIKNNESVIFLAVNDESGEALGFTQLYPYFTSTRMKKAWVLNDLFVYEKHRKSGIGEKLLTAAQEFGKRSGARYMMLETAVENSPAIILYEKLGWKKDEEHFYYYFYY